jgi:hypothetical protein
MIEFSVEPGFYVLVVTLVMGFLVGYGVGLVPRWGWKKPDQNVHLECVTPVDRSYRTPDGEITIPTHSIEEHLKVVNYMHRLLLIEEERIRDAQAGQQEMRAVECVAPETD